MQEYEALFGSWLAGTVSLEHIGERYGGTSSGAHSAAVRGYERGIGHAVTVQSSKSPGRNRPSVSSEYRQTEKGAGKK